MSLHDAYWHVKNKRYAVSPNEVCGIRLLFFAEGRRQKPRLTVAGGQGFMMHLAAYECSLHADEQDFVPSIDPNRYRYEYPLLSPGLVPPLLPPTLPLSRSPLLSRADPGISLPPVRHVGFRCGLTMSVS